MGRNGITEAHNTITFDERCHDFGNYCSGISDKFLTYFNGGLKKHLSTKVNEPVRDGLIPKNWTNNNCESMNHFLKQSVNWRSRPLMELVDLVQDIVVGQFEKLRSALVVGTGEFEMANSHKQFQTSKTEPNNKTISTNGTENRLHATQVL